MLTIIEIVEIRIIITSLCLGSCWPTSGARSGKGYSLAGRTSEPKKTYKLTKGSGHAKSAAKQSSWSHSANHWCKFNFNLMKPAIRAVRLDFSSTPIPELTFDFCWLPWYISWHVFQGTEEMIFPLSRRHIIILASAGPTTWPKSMVMSWCIMVDHQCGNAPPKKQLLLRFRFLHPETTLHAQSWITPCSDPWEQRSWAWRASPEREAVKHEKVSMIGNDSWW